MEQTMKNPYKYSVRIGVKAYQVVCNDNPSEYLINTVNLEEANRLCRKLNGWPVEPPKEEQ